MLRILVSIFAKVRQRLAIGIQEYGVDDGDVDIWIIDARPHQFCNIYFAQETLLASVLRAIMLRAERAALILNGVRLR